METLNSVSILEDTEEFFIPSVPQEINWPISKCFLMYLKLCCNGLLFWLTVLVHVH